ncbi:MAG TPA: outer membrane beta-barrel protein, partial [Niastella sp.]
MQPLHDKDLDRLSREAAELFEVDAGASGWDNLEKRLEIELPQKKKKRRFLFWLLFITATTGGALIGIMTYQPFTPLAKNATNVVTNTPAGNNTTNAVTEQATTGNNTTPATGAQTPAVESTTTATVPAAGTDQPAPAANVSTMPDNNTTTPVKQSGKTINTTSATNKPTTNRSKLSLNHASITPDNSGISSAPIAQHPNRKRGSKKQSDITGQPNKTVKQGRNNNAEPDTQVAENEEPVKTNKPDQSIAQQTTPVAADTEKKDAAVEPAVTDSAKTPAAPVVKKQPEKKQDKKVKGFELGLMAGPDLSTVKFGPVYKTGYNFGVQVGYRFSNRWSVNTGVIYTKKFYKADSSNFNYKMPWNYQVKNAEGNCSMLELPVNVRYDFSYNDKRRWFASTGLSTYFMNNEYYDIYYTYNGNPYQQPYNVDSNTNSNYWFSILNLSVGM